MGTRALVAATLIGGASLAVSPLQSSAAIIVDDFSGGVIAVNHPNPANGGTNANAPTWHDISDNAFATPSAGTLNGSPALTHSDGGFTNGVYTIYQSVVPFTGSFTISADVLVNDTATSQMTAYQIGVIVNGTHRGANPSKIADASIYADYTGLTSGVLDATTTQNLVTQTFSANAGDSLLIAVSTDVTSGYDGNAGFWNGATAQIDNIMLNVIPEPTSLALLGLGGFALLARRRD